MTDFPENWSEVAWAKLPVEIRRRAVKRLRTVYSPSFFEEVSRLAGEKGLGKWLPPGWHFGQGMTVRNVLRSDQAALEVNESLRTSFVGRLFRRQIRAVDLPDAIRDDELPPLPEFYAEGGSTWDDYYVQCVEAAAGLREIEE